MFILMAHFYLQAWMSRQQHWDTVRGLTVRVLARARTYNQQQQQPQRKLVCSLREALKTLPRARLVVVAYDVVSSTGAKYDAAQVRDVIIEEALRGGVPCVTVLSRAEIGHLFGHNKQVACVSLLDITGLEMEYHLLRDLLLRNM